MRSVLNALNLKAILKISVVILFIIVPDTNTNAQPYTLTVSKNGSGGGNITSVPAGIDCGSTCSANFPSGFTVTIIATPDATSTFDGWSGAATGTNTVQTVTMDGNKSVSALFTRSSYTLNITRSGSGSGTITSSPSGINCGATCAASYTAGTTIVLTATPNSGSVFTGWTGGGCSGTGTCTVSMTSAISVDALFTYTSGNYYTDTDGDGYGAGDVIISETQPPNTSINNLDCDDTNPSVHPGATEICGNGTDEDCSGILDDCSKYSFTVSKSGSGGGTISSSPAGIDCGSTCSALFPSGSSVTITATPDATSSFSGWSGALTGTNPTHMIVMDGAKLVSAVFTRNIYPLNVSKTGTGSGTITSSPAGINCGSECTANYVAGSSITLTATPGAGSVFTGWTGGGCSGTGTCVVSMMAASEVSANFCLLPGVPETITGEPLVCSGTVQTYSIAEVPNSTSYLWTLPSGWTGTSAANTVSATAGSTGVISVNAINSCGSGQARTLDVTVKSTPLDFKVKYGLVAGYPFNNNANDESGNGNNGSVHDVTLTTDRFGNANKAFSFNGTSSYIDLGDIDILNPHKNSVTITAWAKKAILNQHSRIFSKGTHGGPQPGYDLMFYPSSGPTKAAVILSAGGHEHIVYSNNPVNDLNWHFYAGVINRQGYINLYVDGIKQNDSINISNHQSEDIAANTYKAFIGASFSNLGNPGPITEYFNGEIDEVQIYMRTLSTEEIKGIFNPVTVTLSVDSICENNPVQISLENSQNGISYQMQNYGNDFGNPQTGNGSTLTFNTGSLSSTAIISIKAADAASTCSIILDTLLNVNVNPVYAFSENDSICSGETYHWHGMDYSTTGTYTAAYTTIHGCDSIYTLHLTVNPGYVFNNQYTMCEGETYTWQGNEYSTAGTYSAEYSTIHGCDSVYTLNLVVNPVYEINQVYRMNEGETYTWQGNIYSNAGTYSAAYSTIHGCDSIYTLRLVVSPVYEINQEYNMCEGEIYTWQGNEYSIGGTYTAAYTTINGGDSIYTLNLVVNPVFDFSEDFEICDGENLNWHGKVYNEPGTYTVAYSTVHGCDSIYTLNLTVKKVDVTVTVAGSVITANLEGAAYRWLNCGNSFEFQSGETFRSFTAPSGGYYAVEVTQGSCTDTSECIPVSPVEVAGMQAEDVSVYPNPVTDKLFIEITGAAEITGFEILNPMGQVIFSDDIMGATVVETSRFDPGIYFLKFRCRTTFQIKKIVIE